MTCSGMSRRRSGPSVQKAVQEVRFQNLGLIILQKKAFRFEDENDYDYEN